MRTHRLTRRVVWQIAAGGMLAAVWCSSVVRADLVIDLPEIVIISDNISTVTGEFEVFLTLTEPELSAPPEISSFNLSFGASPSGTGLTVTNVLPAMTMPLFTGGNFTNNSGGTTPPDDVVAAHDIFDETPDSATAFNNAGLIKVQFSIGPGNVGETYPLVWDVGGTEIADASFSAYPVTLLPGSISVTAVPEANSLLALGLITVMSTGVACIWRRLKTR